MVDLKSPATGALDKEDSQEVLDSYTSTPGFQQVQSYTMEATPAPSVPGMGAPGGGSVTTSASTSVGEVDTSTFVKEYEVFSNDKNAIAFFLYHQPQLDNNAQQGPFHFAIDGDKIIAGTKNFYATSSEVKPDIIAKAKERGVIMLMEFEGQTPVRTTPCYYTDNFFG